MRSDYIPGDGLAVLVDGTAALLPDGCAAELRTALWESMLTGGSLTDHLQVLLRDGLAAAPSFAIVRLEGATAHLVVRGSAQVEITVGDTAEMIGAEQVSTWAEVRRTGVSQVRLTAGRPGAGAQFPARVAVVPATQVVLRTGAPASGTSVAGVASTAAPEAGSPRSVQEPEPRTESPRPEPEPRAETGPRPEPEPEAGLRPEAEIPAETEPRPLPGLRAASPSARVDRPDPDEEADEPAVPAWQPVASVREARREESGQALSEARAVHASTEVPEDHDGLTILSSDVVALRRQLPDWAEDAVPQLSVPTPRTPAPAKLLMSTGLVVSLNRPVLIGRAPQTTRTPGGEVPRLVTVASPNQDISRTHCEIRMDGDDVVVTDLRSTNGVLLLRQGSGAQRLHPGEPTVVEPGVVVDLGEGVTFLVEAGG
ncbi:FHA domain-containing protein [Isoptericola sp. b441]|uniref:FHA domain-containing protein n=1 Tax=Actinotalea lenta TaxID=3064654 RepID=A0ABT9D4X8_9CELL|nr:FHA domain-containing protein [Isoptericola sp. b441]MDO8105782.1 FHA domain-containing protein [Isoptericola sp. b441]